MLTDRTNGRGHDEDRRLAIALACSAGAINALALCAFGFFPSNMTGNATDLSKQIFDIDKSKIQLLILVITFFVAGSLTSRTLTLIGKSFDFGKIYACILLVEGILLTTPVVINNLVVFNPGELLMVSGLAYLLGLHNSTSTQISQGKVRSTHITGTLTDMGIALANILLCPLSQSSNEERARHRKIISLHTTAIISFFCGGVIGVLSFRLFSMDAFAVPGIFIIAISTVGFFESIRKNEGDTSRFL